MWKLIFLAKNFTQYCPWTGVTMCGVVVPVFFSFRSYGALYGPKTVNFHDFVGFLALKGPNYIF